MFKENLFKECDLLKPDSNLQQWEKTILKTISRYKTLFFTHKALFTFRSTN